MAGRLSKQGMRLGLISHWPVERGHGKGRDFSSHMVLTFTFRLKRRVRANQEMCSSMKAVRVGSATES